MAIGNKKMGRPLKFDKPMDYLAIRIPMEHVDRIAKYLKTTRSDAVRQILMSWTPPEIE